MVKEDEHKSYKSVFHDLLKHTHTSLIWVWQAVMSLSLLISIEQSYPFFVSLIQSFSQKIPVFNAPLKEQTDLLLSLNVSSVNPILGLLLFFVAFIPTFIRFYYGISRYIDLSYSEINQITPEAYDKDYHTKLEKISSFKQFINIVMLTISGAAFIFLAKSIRFPLVFIMFYAFIMLINLVWLASINLALKNFNHEHNNHIKNESTLWIVNNIIYLFFFTINFISWKFTNLISIIIFSAILFYYCIKKIFFYSSHIPLVNSIKGQIVNVYYFGEKEEKEENIYVTFILIIFTLCVFRIGDKVDFFIASNIYLIATNSWFDIFNAWEFYFPNFSTRYSAVLLQRANYNLNQGLYYKNLKDFRRAIDYFSEVLKNENIGNDIIINAYLYRGFAHRDLKITENLQDAINDFTHVLKFVDDNDDNKICALLYRGFAYRELTPPKLSRAIEDFSTVLNIDDKNVDALLNRGFAYKESEPPELEKAIHDFGKVLDIVDNKSEKKITALLNRGFAYRDLKKTENLEKAIEDFSQVLSIDNKNIDALLNRGYAHKDLKTAENLEKAIQDFSEVLSIDNTNIDALFNRGFARKELEYRDSPEANKDFQEILLILTKPSNADEYRKKGIAYRELGDNVRAKTHLRMAVKIYERERKTFQMKETQSEISKMRSNW